MADDTTQLIVSLEARIRDFERNMQKAARVSGERWGDIEKSGSQGAKRLEQSFADATKGVNDNLKRVGVGAFGEFNKSARLTRMQMMELAHVSRALFDELAAGQSPMRSLAMEGGRISQIFSTGPGGVTGTLAALGGTFGRYVPLLAAAGGAFAVFETASKSIERLSGALETAEKTGASFGFVENWTKQMKALRLSTDEAKKALEQASAVLQKDLSPASKNDDSLLVRANRNLAAQSGKEAPSAALARDAATMDQMHGAAVATVRAFQQQEEEFRKLGMDIAAAQTHIDGVRLSTELWGDNATKMRDAIAAGKVSVEGLTAPMSDVQRDAERIAEDHKRLVELLGEANAKLGGEFQPTLNAIASLSNSILSVWVSIVEKIGGAVGEASKFASALSRAVAAVGEVTGISRAVRENADIAAAKAPSHGVPFAEAFRHELSPDAAALYDAFGELMRSAPNPVLSDSKQVKEPKTKAGHAGKSDEVERLVKSLENENAALQGEADALGKDNIEREKLIDLAKAEEAARERGKPLTDAERDSVLRLAEAHATLKDKIENARQLDEAFKSSLKGFGDDVKSSFADAIINGEKLDKVLDGLLKKLANRLFDKAFGAIFDSLTGGLSPATFGIAGFASGGLIQGPGGPRSDSILAAVSSGEFVVNAEATKRYGALLAAINSGRVPHFADGGVVGAPSLPNFNISGAGHGGTFAPVINTTVNAQGGTPEQNADLSKQIAARVEESFRAVVRSELLSQMRPGNLLSSNYAHGR
jgi:hypothetical protein